jgi:acetyl esterase/lipase
VTLFSIFSWRSWCLGGSILLLFLMFTHAAAQTPTYIDISYSDDSDSRHTLDIYLPPDGSPPYPTLLMIHGGGFRFGSKDILAPTANYFATRGYAVISINYRMSPRYTYPAQIEDSFCALAWIHAHADEYGFDTARLFAVGESAGGNLAAILGVLNQPTDFLTDCPHTLPESHNLRGVIAYYPMTGLALDEYGFITRVIYNAYLGLTPNDPGYAARRTQAAPITEIDGGEPPFLILHGLTDPIVPLNDSRLLAEALLEADVAVDYLLLAADEHAFIAQLDTEAGLAAAQHVDRFIEEELSR